jgi:hypothetical protein
MALLIGTGDLQTHLYSEISEEIVRGNEDLITTAISVGISEAKSYLGKYDLVQLFGTVDVDPTLTDDNLKNKVKDIAAWQLVKLANPNIDLKLFRTAYEDAIRWLERIQAGKQDPDGWPYKPVDPVTGVDLYSSVKASSNYKRSNHW